MKRLLKAPIKRALAAAGYDVIRRDTLPDADDEIRATIDAVAPYTMTAPERIFGLCNGVRYVATNGIEGAIVECGVWRGGSMMAVALTLLSLGRTDYDLYLFDTFEGMTAPTHRDRHWTSRTAQELLEEDERVWARAPLEGVKAAMASTRYPETRVQFVKGRVEDTIPGRAPERIALLRLDTDWYESTRHELKHLYPRLVPGGVIVIDDYGCWQGAREATDEFISSHNVSLLLNRMDYTGRIGVKLS